MATYTTDKIEFGGNIYKLQDSDALPLTGGSVTGPVNFGDSVTMEEASVGDLLITGNASSTNNFQMNTLNGVAVGSTPKFTDTVTTVTTSGSGNAVTAISASNGAITATKGTTFLTSHQDISGKADKSATVSTVTWDSTNKKLTKTINGTTTDVVTAATLRTGLNVADGAEVNQNAFSNIKIGSTTIAADAKTDTITFAAGSNITLTPDTTNDKITISATDTTYDVATQSTPGLMSATDKTHLDEIGTILSDSSTVSIASNTNWTKTGIKITLTEGKWLLIASAAFPSNNTGRRAIGWRNNTTNTRINASQVNQTALDDAITRIQTCIPVEANNTEFEIETSQTSGSALNVPFYYNIIKIG